MGIANEMKTSSTQFLAKTKRYIMGNTWMSRCFREAKIRTHPKCEACFNPGPEPYFVHRNLPKLCRKQDDNASQSGHTARDAEAAN